MIRQNLKTRDKHRRGKPQAFQSGFVANRKMRIVRVSFPNAEIRIMPVASGKGRLFLIMKVEGGQTTYWGGDDVGFVKLPGEA